MPLTTEQIDALRLLPLDDAPNHVRTARRMLKVRQNVLAEACGFHGSQLSNIERGEYSDIPLENTRKLAGYFGCAIEDLFPAARKTTRSREAVAS